jgi:hypothetical protein
MIYWIERGREEREVRVADRRCRGSSEVRHRCKVGRSAEAPVELPIAFSATLWIGLGLGGVTVSGGKPRTVCHRPLPLLYSAARQGPSAVYGLGTPIRVQVKGLVGGDQFQ